MLTSQRSSSSPVRVVVGIVVLSSALVLGALHGAPPAHAATPGNPGVAQPGTPVFSEDFSNQDLATPVDLTQYTGANGQTYTADAAWSAGAGTCNGWILSGGTPNPPAADTSCGAPWGQLQDIARYTGQFQGQTVAASQANAVVGNFTQADPGPGVQFATRPDVALGTGGHYYAVSAVFGSQNCDLPASETLSLIADGTATPLSTDVDPCTAPGNRQFPGTIVSQVRSAATLLPAGRSVPLGMSLYNGNGSGVGNDFAFDLPQIVDVTPQLDTAFAPATIDQDGTSVLTYTVTNTDELGAKAGWSFSDALPAGLTVDDATAVTSSCPSVAVTAASGATTVSATGSLAAGVVSCTIGVPVTSSTPGTATVRAADFSLVGLNAPADSTLTVAPVNGLQVTNAVSSVTDTNADGANDAGDAVHYAVTVANTGRSTLRNVVVTETVTGATTPVQLTCTPAANPVTLQPAATLSCTGSYTVTSADGTRGSVTATAAAAAADPLGAVVVSNSATASAAVVPTPAAAPIPTQVVPTPVVPTPVVPTPAPIVTPAPAPSDVATAADPGATTPRALAYTGTNVAGDAVAAGVLLLAGALLLVLRRRRTR